MRMMSKSILESAAIVVLTALVLAVMADGAEAKKLSCTSTGTFFTPVPTLDPNTVDVLAVAVGNCTAGFLGAVTFAGVVTAGTVPNGSGCVNISSNGPSTVFNKKGDSFEYTIIGTQCFKDANGNPPTTPGFCGVGQTFTSEIAGLFTITGGTGIHAGASGSGNFVSTANHCDPGFPFGNSYTSVFKGTFLP